MLTLMNSVVNNALIKRFSTEHYTPYAHEKKIFQLGDLQNFLYFIMPRLENPFIHMS